MPRRRFLHDAPAHDEDRKPAPHVPRRIRNSFRHFTKVPFASSFSVLFSFPAIAADTLAPQRFWRPSSVAVGLSARVQTRSWADTSPREHHGRDNGQIEKNVALAERRLAGTERSVGRVRGDGRRRFRTRNVFGFVGLYNNKL